MSRARRAEQTAFYHSDGGTLPTAEGWSTSGTGTLALESSGGVRITSTSGYHLTRPAYDGDSALGPLRSLDDMEVAFRVRGEASSPGWASGLSDIGVVINDGAWRLGVAIGSTLRFFAPSAGATILVIRENHDWTSWHDYLFRKLGSERWQLWLDGELVAEIPYRASDGAGTLPLPAEILVGAHDSTGTSAAVWDALDGGLNQAVAPQWKVERVRQSMPVLLQQLWTRVARGLLRATIGLVQDPYRAIEDVRTALYDGSIVLSQAEWTGDEKVLADDASLPYPFDSLLDAGPSSLVRERQRIVMPGGNSGVLVDYSGPTVSISDHTVIARCTWKVLSYTPDAQGRLGPFYEIRAGGEYINAVLIESSAGGYAWSFCNGGTSGAVAALGREYQVNPFREHEVEIRVFGRDVAILVVDGMIVERLPVTDFTFLPSIPPRIRIFAIGLITGEYELGRPYVEVSACDLNRRALFKQVCQEHLIPVAGCERNDELAANLAHRFGVLAARGTQAGYLVELKRLACCSDVQEAVESAPGGWVLDQSYPDVTPIWLDDDGNLVDVWVEVCGWGRNFTEALFAEWVLRNLLPRSTTDLKYTLAVATLFSAYAPTVGPSGGDLFTVTSSAYFSAGDEISIRDTTNTIIATASVLSVVSTTSIEVDDNTQKWVSGAIRRILGTS